MKSALGCGWVAALSALLVSCDLPVQRFGGLPLETRFAFTNFSLDFYATLGIREHGESPAAFRFVPLLSPGATFRGTFLEFTGTGCPDALDMQLLIYRRAGDDVPIGLDETEAVETTPVVAGETLDVPACGAGTLETYTIINWETEDGVARVKIAQGDTDVERAIIESGIFEGIDATWQVVGVDPALATVAPPPPADVTPFGGTVTLADGTGVAGVGVLLRTRFRVRLDDDDDANDPDAGFGEPIAFATTDENGVFSFDRPAGAYEVEFFSDDLAFRPDSVVVEPPIEVISIVAEPL